jgi:antirestriction protein ArdC
MSVKYETLTNRIVAALEQGVRPWTKEWKGDTSFARPLRSTGEAYRGINALNLWVAAQERGFRSPYWLTYKAAQAMGAQVIKGAKSESVFYSSTFNKVEDNGDERTVPFLKASAVFNADEIEGLPAHFYANTTPVVTVPHLTRHEASEAFLKAIGADIRHGGDSAFYIRKPDYIQLPDFEAFFTSEAYYGTAFHELAHWTGAPHRLDREKGKMFGDSSYAFEELVAELAAAYLCADLGVAAEPREDHASYIGSWIKALKSDPKAIFKAAALAEKAVEYLHREAKGEKPAEAA